MQFAEVKKFILSKLKKELPKHLSYHSVEHVKDVYNSVKEIAKSEDVSGDELKLILTAALFHDSGFLKGQSQHEKQSCIIAKEYLPQYGYTPAQIKQICSMIMSTKIPQSPKNKLEEIMCDADLDYLGRNDFYVIGNKLFSELSIYGIIHTVDEWNKLQVRFLESHNYFTKTSIKLRKAQKEKHLKKIKKLTGK
jgi:hypothetical protein